MVERVAPGVYWLALGWWPPLETNAYLVDDGEVTLVDTGFPLNARRLRAQLAEIGIEPAAIDRVILTHYDLDHVGGLSRLVPELQAPVYLGEVDLSLARSEWDPPWFNHKGLFHRGLRRLYRFPEEISLQPAHHGDVIGGFTVYHTPGHNPGHMAYVHKELGIGILGDLVWNKPRGLVTPVWLDSYDMGTLRESLQTFAERSPPFEVACVGHGTPLRVGGRDAVRALATRITSGRSTG